MGSLRLSKVTRARLGFLIGLATVGVGMYLALGLGWALVATGSGVCAAFVWLYDVSEPEPPKPEEDW